MKKIKKIELVVGNQYLIDKDKPHQIEVVLIALYNNDKFCTVKEISEELEWNTLTKRLEL